MAFSLSSATDGTCECQVSQLYNKDCWTGAAAEDRRGQTLGGSDQGSMHCAKQSWPWRFLSDQLLKTGMSLRVPFPASLANLNSQVLSAGAESSWSCPFGLGLYLPNCRSLQHSLEDPRPLSRVRVLLPWPQGLACSERLPLGQASEGRNNRVCPHSGAGSYFLSYFLGAWTGTSVGRSTANCGR